MKKPATAPKTIFPETHLPFLLNTITSLQTTSLTHLVEAIYQELRAHKVKKNAIEAKIREVGEKCKDRKYWVVRQGVSFLASCGSTPQLVNRFLLPCKRRWI